MSDGDSQEEKQKGLGVVKEGGREGGREGRKELTTTARP